MRARYAMPRDVLPRPAAMFMSLLPMLCCRCRFAAEATLRFVFAATIAFDLSLLKTLRPPRFRHAFIRLQRADAFSPLAAASQR
jgi:hypothetical protein